MSGHADGAVSATATAGDLDEQDPEVGVRPGWPVQDGPGHRQWPRGSCGAWSAGGRGVPLKYVRRACSASPGDHLDAAGDDHDGYPQVCESTACSRCRVRTGQPAIA